MIMDRCLSCLSVCNVGVLWPNGWMDQDVTWYGGRPRSRPHCIGWGSSSRTENGIAALTFCGLRTQVQTAAHVCCGQTAGWISMPLGTEVALGPGHIVLDGDPATPTERGTAPPTFRPMSIVAKRSPISATAELLFKLRPKDRTGSFVEIGF